MVRRRIPPLSRKKGQAFDVREGTAADMPFVRELSRVAFDEFGDYGSFLPSYLEHPSVFTVIAEDRGEPVGFIMLALVASSRPVPWEEEQPGEEDPAAEATALDAELLAIAVAPKHQSRRCGSRLMDHAVTCAEGWHRTVGVRSLQLNVADTNRRARRFFARRGFVELNPFDGFYPRGQRSIRMALRLPEEPHS